MHRTFLHTQSNSTELLFFSSGLLIALLLLVLTLRAARIPGTPFANILFSICAVGWTAGGLLMTSAAHEFGQSLQWASASILDWLTASESFVNPELAKLYGMTPNKTNGFERRIMPPERQGLLGQASILTATSLPDRTSVVLRGKWILEVLLGIPPPPPPPNVPSGSKEHGKNPRCSSCHRSMEKRSQCERPHV